MGSLENRKNWKFSYKLHRVESRAKDLGKWWVVLLFLSIILSCERDTKNRNNCPLLLSEAKSDSLFLSDFLHWHLQQNNGCRGPKLDSEKFTKVNNSFFKCNYVSDDSIVIGKSIVKLITGESLLFPNPFFYVKSNTNKSAYRYILQGNIEIEDSSLFKGEIRLFDLENFVNSNYLMYRDTSLRKDVDKLVLLHSVQSKQIKESISNDVISYFKFNNLVKFDTLFTSFHKDIDNETITNFLLKTFPEKTEQSYFNFDDCPNQENIFYSDTKRKELLKNRNDELNKIRKQINPYLIKGYEKCYENFKSVYEKHYLNEKNTSIYFSKPEMKFYFIRIVEKINRLEIYFRAINIDEYPSVVYKNVFPEGSY